MNKDPLRMQLTKIEVCQSFKQISTVVCCTLDRKGKKQANLLHESLQFLLTQMHRTCRKEKDRYHRKKCIIQD